MVRPQHAAKAILYRHGPEVYRKGRAPPLPVRGADVVALGVSPGPEIGRILAAVERWWIEAGFPSNEVRVRAALAEQAAPHKQS